MKSIHKEENKDEEHRSYLCSKAEPKSMIGNINKKKSFRDTNECFEGFDWTDEFCADDIECVKAFVQKVTGI